MIINGKNMCTGCAAAPECGYWNVNSTAPEVVEGCVESLGAAISDSHGIISGQRGIDLPSQVMMSALTDSDHLVSVRDHAVKLATQADAIGGNVVRYLVPIVE